MGNCLYVLERRDLSGSTFSHYSLTSSNSYLDLYPGISYVESDTSSHQSQWRRSSAPLLDCESGSEYSPTPFHPGTLRAKQGTSTGSTLKSKIRASTTQLLNREKGVPIVLRRSITVESSKPGNCQHLVIRSATKEDTVECDSDSPVFRLSESSPDFSLNSHHFDRNRDRRNRDSNSTVISQL